MPDTTTQQQQGTHTPDRYDDAIEYLNEHPSEIRSAWHSPSLHQAGCLFDYIVDCAAPVACGCLTQIRSGKLPAATPELTVAILADDRIPKDISDVTLDHLPVFAEWQRRADRELDRDF